MISNSSSVSDGGHYSAEAARLQQALTALVTQRIAQAQGWLPFDEFMQIALYAPQLGYYNNALRKFGAWPHSSSDFVTAPELSPLFGQCLTQQAAQIMQTCGVRDIYEFGAGSGALALQICEQMNDYSCGFERYYILEVSAELRHRQQAKLRHLGQRVQWLDAMPQQIKGVVIGNEVLDAMPIKLLHRIGGQWHERGVGLAQTSGLPSATPFIWVDRKSDLRPPCAIAGTHDYLTEIHPQCEAFIRTLAQCLSLGAALFVDYGFAQDEYYHPQRFMGTVMTHHLHRADPDPLSSVGLKDITAHINFTAAALAAQDAGMEVLGYATQGRFLLNCGLLEKAEKINPMQRAYAAKLINEHEMGELFKVLAFGRGPALDLLGFRQGDRSHTL